MFQARKEFIDVTLLAFLRNFNESLRGKAHACNESDVKMSKGCGHA